MSFVKTRLFAKLVIPEVGPLSLGPLGLFNFFLFLYSYHLVSAGRRIGNAIDSCSEDAQFPQRLGILTDVFRNFPQSLQARPLPSKSFPVHH
jgi:hypothetical protein